MQPRHFSLRFSLFGGLLSLLIGVLTFAAPTALALSGKITEFAVPTANGGPVGITAGPDGNLWFTEQNGNQIGRITTAGAITEFPIPTVFSNPFGITAGPDGNLWFTEEFPNQIGRITPAGTITEFSPPTNCGSALDCDPGGITAGPDGNLWFTEFVSNQIGRITPAGGVTEFPVPTAGSGPEPITAGPDGNLWFTEASGNNIGRITTAGAITEFSLPTNCGGSFLGCDPRGITAGPDGNLWFTEEAGSIGRITPAPKHKLAKFPIPTASPKASRRGPIATSGSPRAVTVATRSGASAPLPRTNSASLRSRRRMATPRHHDGARWQPLVRRGAWQQDRATAVKCERARLERTRP